MEKPDGVKQEREQLTEHRSSVVRLPPLVIPSLSPNALQHAARPQHGSVSRRLLPCQARVAVQRVSKHPGRRLERVGRSAELHAAMPVQRLSLGSTTVYLMPSPLSLFPRRRV